VTAAVAAAAAAVAVATMTTMTTMMTTTRHLTCSRTVGTGGPTIVALRRYGDKVRALAVSPDGLRVAVGFDDGFTKV